MKGILQRRLFLWPILCLAVLSGCGKDKDQSDYRQEKLREELGKLQAVQGRYSGIVNSERDSSTLGALELNLTATIKVVDSTSESASYATPILVVNVAFYGTSRMAINAESTYYDSNSGQFTADIPITRQNRTEVVVVSGFISGGQITGFLQARGYNGYGGRFSLSLNGPDLSTLHEEHKPNPSGFTTQQSFQGDTTFLAGPVKPVQVILTNPERDSEEDFLTLLVPVRLLLLTFNYGNGARILFENATYDDRTGKLSGSTTVSTSSGQRLIVVCGLTGENFDCNHTTSSVPTVIAKSIVSPVDHNQPLPDTPDREAVTHVFNGNYEFEPGDIKPIKLTAVYPARSRLEEILLLFFPQSEIELNVAVIDHYGQAIVSFPTAQWDNLNKTLEASVVVGENYRITLSCRAFDFEAQTYTFACRYFSSLTGRELLFNFNSSLQ